MDGFTEPENFPKIKYLLGGEKSERMTRSSPRCVCVCVCVCVCIGRTHKDGDTKGWHATHTHTHTHANTHTPTHSHSHLGKHPALYTCRDECSPASPISSS